MKRPLLWCMAVLLLNACANKDNKNMVLEPDLPESILVQAQTHYESGDKQAAIKLWEQAATEGDAIAQHNLSIVYRLGDGVTKDEQKALTWLEQSVSQDYAPAIYDMGSFYLRQGNSAKAATLLRSAVSQEYAPAQFNFGLMLVNGDGIEQNKTEGITLIQQSAEQGFAPAKQALQEQLK